MATGRRFALVAVLLLASAAVAEGPRAIRVDPARRGETLVADMAFENLFPRPIENTLRSGLPVVIDCAVELLIDEGGARPRGILLRSELGYDVWEGLYSLRRGDHNRIFEDFLSLRRACENLEALPLAALDELPSSASFHIRLRVAVNPFAGEDNDRMARWLAETISDPRDSSAREFRLDLGGLIDGFFRSTDRKRGWSEPQRFGPYRIDRLGEVPADSSHEGDRP